jgi:hypothetical protein
MAGYGETHTPPRRTKSFLSHVDRTICPLDPLAYTIRQGATPRHGGGTALTDDAVVFAAILFARLEVSDNLFKMSSPTVCPSQPFRPSKPEDVAQPAENRGSICLARRGTRTTKADMIEGSRKKGDHLVAVAANNRR